jgi:hypothetical protein
MGTGRRSFKNLRALKSNKNSLRVEAATLPNATTTINCTVAQLH